MRSDNTYEVKIDNKKAESGKLEEDWDFLAPRTIPDPESKKPEDWDDRPKIDDPEAEKPEVSGKWGVDFRLPVQTGLNWHMCEFWWEWKKTAHVLEKFFDKG